MISQLCLLVGLIVLSYKCAKAIILGIITVARMLSMYYPVLKMVCHLLDFSVLLCHTSWFAMLVAMVMWHDLGLLGADIAIDHLPKTALGVDDQLSCF